MNRTLRCSLVGLLLASALISGCKDEKPDVPPLVTPVIFEDYATNPVPEDAERVVLSIELESGETTELVYTVLQAPSEESSAAVGTDDTITVSFAAALDRGAGGIEIYDSTDRRNRDFSFSLADPGVIRGLREAVPGMRVGEVRRIEIPWRLAYGENGRGEIPPSTDLVFVVELLSVD